MHLGFDFFQVFRSKRLVANEFVEKTIFDRRTDAQLHVWIEFEHSGSEQMSGGMTKHLQRVGILCSEDRELGIVIERARKVREFAIGTRNQSFLGQARRDLGGDLRGSGAARDFASRAIGQSDLDGVHAESFCGVEQLAYWRV